MAGGETGDTKRLIDEALDQADKATKIAEAEVAQALGYALCKCGFSPTPMRTVGYRMARGGSTRELAGLRVPEMQLQHWCGLAV